MEFLEYKFFCSHAGNRRGGTLWYKYGFGVYFNLIDAGG